jgi:hypothetical protein
MPEGKSRFLKDLIDKNGPETETKSFTAERQHTAQAFNLHVERRDGRRSEGFAWSHYVGYRWTDEGEHERLVVLFGARAVEIEGHQLGALIDEIREGQLNSIRELVSSKAMLLQQANPENEPVISSVKTYPDFEEILKEIKGDGEHDTGFAGKVRGR